MSKARKVTTSAVMKVKLPALKGRANYANYGVGLVYCYSRPILYE